MFGQRGAPHACVKKHVGAATPTDFLRASPRKYRGAQAPEPPLFLRHWCCELHVLFFIPSSLTSSFFHVLLIVTYLVRFHFFSLPFPSLPPFPPPCRGDREPSTSSVCQPPAAPGVIWSYPHPQTHLGQKLSALSNCHPQSRALQSRPFPHCETTLWLILLSHFFVDQWFQTGENP